jgi:hypothetical protein
MLGVFLGHPHAYQGAKQPTGRRPDAGTGKSRGQGAARDDRAYTGNGQGSHSSQEADYSTQHASTYGTGSRALSSLSAGPLDQILLLLTILDGDTDLILGEADFLETLDGPFGVCLIVEESNHSVSGGLFVPFAHHYSLHFADPSSSVLPA